MLRQETSNLSRVLTKNISSTSCTDSSRRKVIPHLPRKKKEEHQLPYELPITTHWRPFSLSLAVMSKPLIALTRGLQSVQIRIYALLFKELMRAIPRFSLRGRFRL